MTSFTYELPPEHNPVEPLQGLSDAALTSLSELAVGPRPAEQLLEPEAEADNDSGPVIKNQETLLRESWEEMERFAGQMHPGSPGAQKRFLEEFGTYWDDTKAEPIIHHWAEEAAGFKTIERDYVLTIPGFSHARITDLAVPRNLLMTKLICDSHSGYRVTSLPDSLVELHCRSNYLTKLPDLPAGLQVLECDNNELQALPDLPHSLRELRCAGNKLTALPDLPDKLTTLDCGSNESMAALPTLPAGLERLHSRHTSLTALPDLPRRLEHLDCGYSELTDLPPLPRNLKQLICNDNYIKTLPPLPDDLSCYAARNPLEEESRKRLKKHNVSRFFRLKW